MDIEKQKAIATSRTVDNLRLLMMSCIEGASETSQLLYEQLISGEVRKIGVRNFSIVNQPTFYLGAAKRLLPNHHQHSKKIPRYFPSY